MGDGISMGWFKDRKPRLAQKIKVPTTRFIGEQDGVPERELKARFSELFRQESMVQRAYLARAEHGDGKGIHVTLAVRRSGGEDPSLIPKLGQIFAEMFSSHEHLDTMFIRDDEERELRMVCAPFYEAASQLS
jgi:hypothetical protein